MERGRKRSFPEIENRRVVKVWQNINVRCTRPIVKSYPQYGGRGIKNLLTPRDLEFLWNRDGADQMKRPSIDRIDSDGHYTIENCRFIELSENSRPDPTKPRKPRTLPPKFPLPPVDERLDRRKRYFDVGDTITWLELGWQEKPKEATVMKIKRGKFEIYYMVGEKENVYVNEIERGRRMICET